MALRTASAAALVVTFLAAATLLLVGFFGSVTIDLPGILEVQSGTAGAHQVELSFNPLTPILVVLVLSMVIWLAGRAVRSVI